MTTMPQTTEDRRKKRAAIARFAFAGVAVLGIGAAATSAAWTDDAWFAASATGATFEIQGMDDSWVDADDADNAIEIPASALANLVQDETRTFEIEIKNASTVGATITASYEFVGSTFEANPTVELIDVPAALAVDAEATVTVKVTTLADWAEANMGKSGTLRISFTGTTEL